MRISKNDIPIKINAPNARARQQTDFGDASNYGAMGGEHFKLDAGTDISSLLEGLENDLCQSPHWGYMIGGELTVTFDGGKEEKTTTGDLFYWPPGHTVKADKDSEFVLFSPQNEHTKVMDHINDKLNQ